MSEPLMVMSGGFGCFYAPAIGESPPGCSELCVTKVTSQPEAEKAAVASRHLSHWDPEGLYHVKVLSVKHSSFQESRNFPCNINGRRAEGALMYMEYGGISLQMLKTNLSLSVEGQRPLKLDKLFFIAFANIFKAFDIFTQKIKSNNFFVHGDLKPGNILITTNRDGLRIRLIDFDWSVAVYPGVKHNPFIGTSFLSQEIPYLYWPPEAALFTFTEPRHFYVIGRDVSESEVKGQVKRFYGRSFATYTRRLLNTVNPRLPKRSDGSPFFDVEGGVKDVKEMFDEHIDKIIRVSYREAFVSDHGVPETAGYYVEFTPEMSMEIYRRFDTWALGITLLELLQKRTLVTDDEEVKSRVWNFDEETISPKVMEQLMTLLRKMTEPAFTKRLTAQKASEAYHKIFGIEKPGLISRILSWTSGIFDLGKWYKTLYLNIVGSNDIPSHVEGTYSPLGEAVEQSAPLGIQRLRDRGRDRRRQLASPIRTGMRKKKIEPLGLREFTKGIFSNPFR